MAKKIKMLPRTKLKVKSGTMRLDLDLKRFEKQFQDAQYSLDNMVMASMVPIMPMQTGNFIDITTGMSAALAGSGKVIAAAPPYGRFLYYGKVMVDSATGKGPMKIPDGLNGYELRFRKGAKLKPTTRNLKYSRADARPEWFEVAKERHGDNWVSVTKKIAGGGKRG